MTHRPLIFDSDGGVDDSQALIMLVANGRAPDHITSVFGNVGRDQATTNLLAVTATLGVSIPVHKGADRPLTQAVIDAKYVHGEDGIGGAPRPPRQDEPQAEDAVHLLIRLFRDAPAAAGTKIDILMIGPFTNLALALRLDPAIVDGIGTLTIMGGNVYGRGNTTPAAEFNVYADPEAAQHRVHRRHRDGDRAVGTLHHPFHRRPACRCAVRGRAKRSGARLLQGARRSRPRRAGELERLRPAVLCRSRWRRPCCSTLP